MPAARSKRNDRPELWVQRLGPFGRMPRRAVLLLRPEQIHPVVRIAHRQSGLTIPERVIFDYELVLVVKGTGFWEIAGEKRPFAPHDLLYVPPFVPHRFWADEKTPVEHVAVHFDFAENLPPADAGIDARKPFRVRFTHGLRIPRQRRLFQGHRIERALTAILSEHAAGGVLGAANVSVQLAGVLLALLAEPEKNRPSGQLTQLNQTRVQAVVAHMQANLARPITQAALERVARLSSSRLQALFREVTGYPPLDYLRRLRVEEARRLLAEPTLSVKEIAARTGFRDTSHFSKVFRRVDGLSPAHFRDALLAGRGL
ncbi:MAG: helix-turn-helix domain-containing protein [Opitutaceae bacterium]|nr:helix-turn-helix domain-containing protein [Cephaloticoccus sp.]MCP5529984.1 helix-turn-helix domain-containing protein [Opitutaceae bacterium]